MKTIHKSIPQTFLAIGMLIVVSSITIIIGTASAGTISSASVTPVYLEENTKNQVTINLTTSNDLPADGKIKILFPNGFDISKASANSCTVLGEFYLTTSGQTLTITRSGTNDQTISGGSTIVCQISNIRNPLAGITPPFQISTSNKNDLEIDRNITIAGVNIFTNNTSTPSGQCSIYSDIKSTDPICPAITYVTNEAIFGGYPDETFQPNKIINRVETTKVTMLGFKRQIKNCDGLTTQAFNDTDPTQWYCDYVQSAKAIGVLEGYPDGSLRPNQQINRVELLKVFFVSAGKDLSGINVGTAAYRDTLANVWYSKYVQYAKNYGLVSVSNDGYYYPAEGMKRGDVAELFYRYHQAGLL